MKVEVKSKKGLRTVLSVMVDKKSIQTKMEEKLDELQKEVALKGFRPGKVPPAVIKSQFGKSIYGEVVDKILRETSSKAIDEKKLKVAGQPKIDILAFKFFFEFIFTFIFLVGKKRLELLSLAALVPKTSAYTNSATCPC